MKKLIFVLTVAFMLVSGNVIAATVNCIIYASENRSDPMVGPLPFPIISDHTFTIEIDDITGDVVAFTDLFGSNFLAYEYGGWDTEDDAPFDAGEQIFKDSITYNMPDIIYDGTPVSESGHGLWFRCQEQITWGGMAFSIGIFGINFDGTDGDVAVGPTLDLTDHYVFHAVPIPASAWLLLSGLMGLAGFRIKFKE